MRSEWREATVEELITEGVIAPPLDGNHGEIHPKAGDFVASGVPFIMASDLKDGQVDTTNCSFISAAQASRLRKGFAKKGDVLLSHKATIGRTAIVGAFDGDFLVLTPQVTYYRVMDYKTLNNRYLKYYFDSRPFQETLAAWSGSGSTRAYLGITAQRKLPIVLPPIELQVEIASIIGGLDDRITLLRETNATLEAIAQVLFKSWFVDFDPVRAKAESRQPEGMDAATAALFPDSFEESELGLVPRGWQIFTLGEVAVVKGGKQLERECFTENGKNPVFGGAGVMGRSDSRNASGFVITVGRVGAYCGQFFWHIGDAWVNNNASQMLPNSEISSVWLYEFLKSTDIERIKKGAAQPFVSNGDLAGLKMVLPASEILQCFSHVADQIYQRMHSLQQQAQTLTQLRDTLLPRLISGQLRLPEAEALVEEVV